jgi:hypothetical protein
VGLGLRVSFGLAGKGFEECVDLLVTGPRRLGVGFLSPWGRVVGGVGLEDRQRELLEEFNLFRVAGGTVKNLP